MPTIATGRMERMADRKIIELSFGLDDRAYGRLRLQVASTFARTLYRSFSERPDLRED
jgi:hypothetical protein